MGHWDIIFAALEAAKGLAWLFAIMGLGSVLRAWARHLDRTQH